VKTITKEEAEDLLYKSLYGHIPLSYIQTMLTALENSKLIEFKKKLSLVDKLKQARITIADNSGRITIGPMTDRTIDDLLNIFKDHIAEHYGMSHLNIFTAHEAKLK
jgi:hypothetical protein